MARMWTCGFELQSPTAEFGVNSGVIVSGATPTMSTTIKRAGTCAAQFNPSANTSFIEHQLTSGVVMRTFHRLYLRVNTRPDVETNVYAIGQAGFFPASLRLKTDGTLVLRDSNIGSTLVGASAALTTGQWYRIELDYTDVSGTITSGVSAFKGYLDGALFADTLCSNINGFSRIRMGVNGVSATCDLSMDDVAVNDTTGSVQNSLPGPGSVVHLRPNAAGDNNGWATAVGGTAGAGNNYTRVSERTPDDATSYNQTTATGTTTIDDFNVEDAAMAGIGASDTVTLVQVGGRVASDNTTAASIVYRLKGQASGTVQESASVTVANASWSAHAGQSPRPYQLTAYTNPQGSVAWTPTALDGIQVGYRGDVSQTTVRRVSTLWALVEFVPATSAALTLASETDSGQALARGKTKSLTLGTETGTAQALARRKTRALGTATEISTGQALARVKSRAVVPALGTDAAQGLSRRKTKALGTAGSTDTAQALGHSRARALTAAAETETASSLAPASGLQLAQEVSTARPLTQIKTRALSQSGESATSLSLGGGKVRALGPAQETWTARLLTGAKARMVGVASETASARSLAGAKTGLLSTAQAVETARSATGSQATALATASETSTAQPLARSKRRLLGPAVETSTARPPGTAKTAPLPPAEALEEAQRLAIPGRMVPVEETSKARALGAAKRRPLSSSSETSSAQALARRKLVTLPLAVDVEAARVLARAKALSLGTATASDAARPVGAVKHIALGTAGETSRALIGPKIRLTQAVDQHQALALIGRRQRPADHLDTSTSGPVLTPSTSGPGLTASSSGPHLAASTTTGG